MCFVFVCMYLCVCICVRLKNLGLVWFWCVRCVEIGDFDVFVCFDVRWNGIRWIFRVLSEKCGGIVCFSVRFVWRSICDSCVCVCVCLVCGVVLRRVSLMFFGKVFTFLFFGYLKEMILILCVCISVCLFGLGYTFLMKKILVLFFGYACR